MLFGGIRYLYVCRKKWKGKNKEERKKLQDYLNYLQDTYEIGNSEDDFYSEEEDEWPDEFDIKSILLDFPYEYDNPCYPIEEFMATCRI